MDRDLDKLEDILTATADIADFVAELDYASFVAERGRRYSILHAFTIIGEASSQLSTELRARHSQFLGGASLTSGIEWFTVMVC